ncbi:hypothetical protein BOTBODRAFT_36385 [Botryobasidium botryosum FD-172 SS1]|uniref:Uncharacterized protein n=1 Tax=Botryobasidium botryosum (strain FD-172 SS1) TaxID=930990 RepID=A0A067M3Z5_BOTB1|nr:hypothetical protein BOTBODRAFT_36385 [Botryobasidium botryosum FD-172 SS1]
MIARCRANDTLAIVIPNASNHLRSIEEGLGAAMSAVRIIARTIAGRRKDRRGSESSYRRC